MAARCRSCSIRRRGGSARQAARSSRGRGGERAAGRPPLLPARPASRASAAARAGRTGQGRRRHRCARAHGRPARAARRALRSAGSSSGRRSMLPRRSGISHQRGGLGPGRRPPAHGGGAARRRLRWRHRGPDPATASALPQRPRRRSRPGVPPRRPVPRGGPVGGGLVGLGGLAGVRGALLPGSSGSATARPGSGRRSAPAAPAAARHPTGAQAGRAGVAQQVIGAGVAEGRHLALRRQPGPPQRVPVMGDRVLEEHVRAGRGARGGSPTCPCAAPPCG